MDFVCVCVCVFYMGFKWNFGHWSVSQYVPVQFYVVEPHDVYLISTASDLPLITCKLEIQYWPRTTTPLVHGCLMVPEGALHNFSCQEPWIHRIHIADRFMQRAATLEPLEPFSRCPCSSSLCSFLRCHWNTKLKVFDPPVALCPIWSAAERPIPLLTQALASQVLLKTLALKT